MEKFLRSLLLVTACAMPIAMISGCDVKEGPAEEAGEAVDEATDAD